MKKEPSQDISTNASAETVNRAAEIRTLAERQMGEFLKGMPKAKGGANYHNADSKRAPGDNSESSPTVITRGDLGIEHHQTRRAQKLASIPADEFAERIAVAKAGQLAARATSRQSLNSSPLSTASDSRSST